MDSNCFKLRPSSLISFNLSNVGEIFWFEYERAVSKLRKRKKKFVLGLTYSIKRASKVREFHVAVVQQRLKNAHKNVIHVQSCSFAKLNLLLFLLLQNPLLLWSRNFATIETWRHTFSLCSAYFYGTDLVASLIVMQSWAKRGTRPKQLLVFTWKSPQTPPG